MESLSNGNLLSDGKLKRRLLENGDCPSSSSVPPLKYKHRKVSAIRDFPPGCGPNAPPPVNLRPQETTVAPAVVADKVAEADGTTNIENSESEFHGGGNNPTPQEMADSLDHLVEQVVASAGMVTGVELFSSNLETIAVELPKDLENNGMELTRETHERKSLGVPVNKPVLEVCDMVNEEVDKSLSPPHLPSTDADITEGIRPKNKYPQRRVSSIRDFPPFCGRNAPEPSEEDRLRIVSRNKCLEVLREISKGMVGASSEEPKGNVGDGNEHKSEENEIVAEPRKKTHTVSAGEEEPEGIVRDGAQKSESKDIVLSSRKKTRTVRAGDKEEEGNVVDENVQKSESKGIVPVSREKILTVQGSDEEEVENAQDGNPYRSESKEIVLASRETTCTVRGDGEEEEEEGYVGDGNVEKSESKEIVVVSREKARTVRGSGEEQEGNAQDRNVEKSESKEIVPERKKKIQKSKKDIKDMADNAGKEIVVYSPGKSFTENPSDALVLGSDVDRVVVVSLLAAPNCPWRQGRGAVASPDSVTSRSKAKKKSKLGTKMNCNESNPSIGKSMKEKASGKTSGELVVKDEEDYVVGNEEQNEGSPVHEDSPVVLKPRDFNVSLPPFGPNSSSQGDARNRVREVLRLFQAVVRKLLQGEEAKSRLGEEAKSKQPRIDLLAAKIVREKGKEVNTGKQTLGDVPGIEIGDEFQYRVELAIVGIHRLYQGGIDYIKQGKELVAASIVASGGYADELDSADTLIYSGQGGNPTGKDKQPEDQKLERGNLALKNSISIKNPVRVVRGSKETRAADSDSKGKLVVTYVYDGLYTVERYWQDVGPHGKLVFKFELRRVPGQPELAWKEVKKSKKFKTREGLCVDDISGGKELFPICAVNTVDDETPPSFTYITSMMFPDHYSPITPKGCDCTGGCVDSHRCSCAVNNGGELPYNYNGAIVEAKPLVYECGPSCKCPPSCHNRVSQHGIKIQLEIFKTGSRGWGVRSLNSITSGSFICEYIGELLEDKEAEQRTGNDEYLFDIGQNYSDCSLGNDAQLSSNEVSEDGGFTIDAVEFGNVGRFINHSCSPNLYAQNVLYDNDDKRIPHIMFFAAENIPPLTELTYHYNYSVDQVRDSNGNIKKKSCYCGSAECTGRLY